MLKEVRHPLDNSRLIFTQTIAPVTSWWSDNPLVRQPIGSTAHWSDSPLDRQPISPTAALTL